MSATKVLGIYYEKSDSITHQGNESSIQTFKKNGYYVKMRANGYWVLVKPSKVIVTLKNSNGTASFDMRQDVMKCYDKKRISEKTVNVFKEDVKQERIKIEMTEDCKAYSFSEE